MLPCSTPEVTLTSLDSCPPTLTLCVRRTRNFLALNNYPQIHARGNLILWCFPTYDFISQPLKTKITAR
jgi:hypothetical protein